MSPKIHLEFTKLVDIMEMKWLKLLRNVKNDEFSCLVEPRGSWQDTRLFLQRWPRHGHKISSHNYF
jgi:hypothetical protein